MNFLVEANMAAYSGPGSTHQVLGKSFVWLFACYLLFGCTATWNISTEEKYIYVDDDDNDWWEARYHCNETFGGDLFVPVTEPVPEDLFRSLDWNRHYWLGAMRYSTWKWTEDGTPLYTHIGYTSLPQEEGTSIPDNSVFSCHLCCDEKGAFGLSRDMCYCLRENFEANYISIQEMPCPGNLDEVCGDANGMSVYKLEFAFEPKKDRLCGYAKRENGISLFSKKIKDCGMDTKYACYANSKYWNSTDGCSGGVCVGHVKNTWLQAYHTRKLVKLNSSIENNLMNRMESDVTCWIGLLNHLTRQWINAKPRTSPKPYPSSSPSTTTKTTAVFETEASSRASTPDGSTTGRNAYTNTPSPVAGHTETHSRSTASHNTKTGMFVGLGLGCVVLILAAIIVVLLVMRQNKLCFKRKDRDQPVHFNTVTRNATYDQLDVPAQTDNLYTAIVPSDTTGDKPVSPTVPMATVQPRVQTENTSRVNNDDEGDYNVITHQGMAPREVDDSYSHIGRTNKVFEEDAYDVASTKQAEDRRDDTYNHTASVNENAGDTTDYYNTRSLVGDNNEGLDRQGETPENTDVYSFAKGISNA
ncbi:uncharacterized protein [Haliotis cracherodii]|uniref:uncharacterized protein isoform X2 n=1 Tax=Haliotis cracherodii TaxID=6455 RepID=UPI0039E7F8DA